MPLSTPTEPEPASGGPTGAKARRWPVWLRRILLGLVVLVLAGGGAVWMGLRGSLARLDGEVTLPNSSATDPATDWPARNWYSHTVTMPEGKVVASAVIDHPANPPSLWHGARGVSFLNPCISAPGPVTIAAGKPLMLRYRAIAHDGAFAEGWLDRMAARWRAT